MDRRIFLQGSLAAACAAAASPAEAQAPGEHRVNGFRGALFGMNEAEVRSAIARDFQAPAEAMDMLQNAAEQTTVLVLRLPALAPGPGAARVHYVFGAESKRLMHVSVVWQSGTAPDTAERGLYAAAGLRLTAYFRALPWGPRTAASPSPAGPAGLVLFAGVDARGSGVEVRVLGVAVVSPDGKEGPAPAGPAQLRVAYHANVAQPDVRVKA